MNGSRSAGISKRQANMLSLYQLNCNTHLIRITLKQNCKSVLRKVNSAIPLTAVLAGFVLLGSTPAEAQECCQQPAAAVIAPAPVVVPQVTGPQYRNVERTVYDQTPVKVKMQVNETVMERQTVTTSRPIYNTETRERKTYTLKPVIRTSEREEKTTVLRPVVETVLEDKVRDETVFDTITVMEDQQFVVEEPVTETKTRTERVLVRKPVTREVMRSEEITALRPMTVKDTQLTPAELEYQQLSPVPGTSGMRRQWLDGGYYTDPATGQSVYRKRGFHWVGQQQQYTLQTARVPVMTQQQVDRVTLVPEKVTVNKPVNVTTMEEVYEERDVPYEVQTTRRRIETRQVPVEKQVPRTVRVTERVPVERTRMVEETITRQVPVREMEYQTVEHVEEYEQPVVEWKDVVREVEVPRVVTREVEVELLKHTPRTVTMRVPLDAYGNPVGLPEPAQNVSQSTTRFGDPVTAAKRAIEEARSNRTNPAIMAQGQWETVDSPMQALTEPSASLIVEPEQKQLRETSQRVEGQQNAEGESFQGATSVLDRGTTQTEPTQAEQRFQEFRSRPTPVESIIVPETTQQSTFNNQPRTELTQVWRPEIPGRERINVGEPESETTDGTDSETNSETSQAPPVTPPAVSGTNPSQQETAARQEPVAEPATGDAVFQNDLPAEDVEQADQVERTDGGTSLRDRFPGAEILTDPTDAADLTPQIERRID